MNEKQRARCAQQSSPGVHAHGKRLLFRGLYPALGQEGRSALVSDVVGILMKVLMQRVRSSKGLNKKKKREGKNRAGGFERDIVQQRLKKEVTSFTDTSIIRMAIIATTMESSS